MHLAPLHILYMKIGGHAGETLSTIIRRKNDEIYQTGFCFWGYGGSCCHPHKQVIPHCRIAMTSAENVKVYMEVVSSSIVPKASEALMFSDDGNNFRELPSGIRVTGSKWALVFKALECVEEKLNLADYEIAVGQNAGRGATEYLRGRVDKACLRRRECNRHTVVAKNISLIGTLASPYAVYLR